MAREPESNEIRFSRVYDAPVRAVWDAWTDLAQVEKWWGPRGFTLTTHEKDLRPGGSWRYTMHGPDGTDYPNITTYHVVEPLAKLVYDHGATPSTPPLFRVTVNFAEKEGKTTMNMTFVFATPDAARDIAQFIKQAQGYSTWDRLAEHLVDARAGVPCFVITESIEAERAQVFAMWTSPERLARWLPPKGTELRVLHGEIAQGKSATMEFAGRHGVLRACFDYQTIEAPERLVYEQVFVDEAGQPLSTPFGGPFPARLRMSVLFTEESGGYTRVRVVCEPQGAFTAEQLAAFVAERGGMTTGWGGSFDALEAELAG